MKRDKAVYVEKPLCNTLHETRLLTEYARTPRPHDADGHPGLVDAGRNSTAKRSSAAASSARSRRSTPSRTRAGATTSRCEVKGDAVPAPLDWDDWLGVNAPRPFIQKALSPGRMAAAHRVRHRHARRHGLPHLQPAVSRAEADVADRGHGVRARAPTAENWATKARVKLTYPGDRVHRRRRRSTCGGTTAASCRRTRFASRSAPASRSKAASSSARPGCWCCRTAATARSWSATARRRRCRRSTCRSAITTASSSTSCSAAARRSARPTSTTPGR